MRWLRISLATMLLLVATGSVVVALFLRVLPLAFDGILCHWSGDPGPSEVEHRMATCFVGSIVSTGAALAAWARHPARQAMLQILVTCVVCFGLISLIEQGFGRPMIYNYQASFAVLVMAPLAVRRAIHDAMEPGPRRDGRMKTCEAVALGMLNLALVLAGIALQRAMDGLSIPPVPVPVPSG